MLLEDLIGKNSALSSKELTTLRSHCGQFIRESAGLPLLRSLPQSYGDFQRVKVRLRKHRTSVAEMFDQAFGQTFANLSQRAVFAYPTHPPIAEDAEPFYVFPIDGYQFLYSKEVTNSSNDYKHVVDTLFEQFEDPSKASEIVADLLKYTYSSQNLYEGMMANSEIILYGIPYYYAVRASAVPSYTSINP